MQLGRYGDGSAVMFRHASSCLGTFWGHPDLKADKKKPRKLAGLNSKSLI